MTNSDCGLCRAPYETFRLTAENESAVSAVIYNPLNAGHQIIIPKRHVVDWKDLSPKEAKSLLDLTDEVENRLAELFPDQPPITIRQRGKHSTEPHSHYQVFPSDAHGRLLYARAHEPGHNDTGALYRGEWNDKTTKPIIPGTDSGDGKTLERFLGSIAEGIRGSGNVEKDRRKLRELTHEILSYNGLL